MTGSSIKLTTEWSLTHYDTMKISRGKNTVLIDSLAHTSLAKCLNFTQKKSLRKSQSGKCEQVIVPNLIPKFVVLHLKSPDADVKPEMMIHKPSKSHV